MLSARKTDGRVRPLGGMKNLILDRFLNQIAAESTYLDACQVGTSGVAPDVAQTALIAPTVGTANRVAANSAAANAAPWRGFSQITYRFPLGAVTGVIREVAIGNSATVGSLVVCRALTPNVYGEAAEIELFADEQLDVQYELSVYAPENDVVGTCLVNGVEVGYTARAAFASNGGVWAPYRASSFASSGQAVRALFTTTGSSHIAAFSGGLGAITSSPAGSSGNCAGVSNQTYVTGDYRRLGSAFWDLGVANFAGGIKSLAFRFGTVSGTGGNSLGGYQVEFDTAIPKTALEDFRAQVGISWGRA